jgi:hypothetical protein
VLSYFSTPVEGGALLNLSRSQRKMIRAHIPIIILLAALCTEARAANPGSPSANCEALQSIDFSTLQDTPTQIIEAKTLEAQQGRPELCDVQGYVSPNVGFHLQLPASNWNHKFIEVGCGGACGGFFDILCNTPLLRGYACIASDMGHKSTTQDLKWALNNWPGQIDWAFRATHVVAIAGKAIVSKYYEHEAEKSYMMGCSTGGHQGLIEAQRFPWDFDGIVAGAPSISMQTWGLNAFWENQVLRDRSGHPLFTSADIRLLHEKVLSKCDLDDGVKDGVVGDPSSCRVDLDELICKADKNDRCLTRDQVQAAKMRYAGPLTSVGERIAGGAALGSEVNWLDNLATRPAYLLDLFRYLNFMPAPGTDWRLSDLDLDRDYKRLGVIDSFYSASNPDLRRFERAGGKMIVYHGWEDPGPSPAQTIDYYETVTKTMGGLKSTQEFFRLFLVPGMNHCTGGDGAFVIDYLTYLENWVERGEAPKVMIGAHVPSHREGLSAWGLTLPLAPSTPVSFTRPIYPYPLHAKYKGRGDPNKAEDFLSIGPQD